jgi:dUTP pyrophosphatase
VCLFVCVGLWPLSARATVIPAKGKAIVPTDISIALPDGCYGLSSLLECSVHVTSAHSSLYAWAHARGAGSGRVAPRSGLAVKHFLDVGAGVIDGDYRGAVGVVMFNFSDVDYQGAWRRQSPVTYMCMLVCAHVYACA